MSKVFRTKEWLTIAQLTPAWSCELANATEDPKQCEQDLVHTLLEDIVHGRLDNSGPRRDGRRLGLRFIKEDNKAGFIEGPELLDLIRINKSYVLNHVVIMKEAALDFAKRREIPPPSWWRDQDEGTTSSANVSTNDIAANGTRSPSPSRGKQPRIIEYLKEHFPEGVPDPGIYPRKKLKDEILKADPTLKPLDEATLKKVIEKHNASFPKNP